MADIEALLAAGKAKEAQAAISEARRNLELSGAEARALGRQVDEILEAASQAKNKGRK